MRDVRRFEIEQTPLGIIAVDLFCGAGGLSLGLKNSGLTIGGGVDLDPACRYPYETGVGARFLSRDVAEFRSCELNALFGNSAVRVLAGCAPCQPFSRYTTKRHETDERWQLLLEFLRLARESQPEIVTMENVPGLARLPLWSNFVAGLHDAGYQVAWGVLDASDFGVAQERQRLVLLASRLGLISLPQKTGCALTVRSVLETLPAVEAGQTHSSDRLHGARTLTPLNMRRIRASKPAGSWKDWPKELLATCHRSERGRTYVSVYGRMSWDKPSPTITTQFYGFGNGRFGHPEQDRALTLREGAVLQSFPPDFPFVPEYERISVKKVGRLIGNAVPPKLGEAIGRAIVAHVTVASNCPAGSGADSAR